MVSAVSSWSTVFLGFGPILHKYSREKNVPVCFPVQCAQNRAITTNGATGASTGDEIGPAMPVGREDPGTEGAQMENQKLKFMFQKRFVSECIFKIKKLLTYYLLF